MSAGVMQAHSMRAHTHHIHVYARTVFAGASLRRRLRFLCAVCRVFAALWWAEPSVWVRGSGWVVVWWWIGLVGGASGMCVWHCTRCGKFSARQPRARAPLGHAWAAACSCLTVRGVAGFAVGWGGAVLWRCSAAFGPAARAGCWRWTGVGGDRGCAWCLLGAAALWAVCLFAGFGGLLSCGVDDGATMAGITTRPYVERRETAMVACWSKTACGRARTGVCRDLARAAIACGPQGSTQDEQRGCIGGHWRVKV